MSFEGGIFQHSLLQIWQQKRQQSSLPQAHLDPRRVPKENSRTLREFLVHVNADELDMSESDGAV